MRTTEPAAFGAPVGTRVRVITALSLGLVLAFVVVDLVLALVMRAKPAVFWAMTLSPLVGFAVIVPVWIYGRVTGYRIDGGELQVLRVSRVNRFGLAGLESVEADGEPLKGAWKTIGNDGLGAITGNFRSKKLGKFEALLTDPPRGVVLRWKDHTLVVSPERSQEFVETVRAHAGLRR